MMTGVFLRKKISNRIALGHPWVFANEIGDITGSYLPGAIISVYSSNGSFVGKGFINPASKIRVRFLTRNKEEEIDAAFFKKKIESAWQLRQKMERDQVGRIVFSESDYLPGLIVDKFEDILVFQTLSLGIDIWKPVIVKALSVIFNTTKIYEKNDASVRELENLSLIKDYSLKEFTNPINIEISGLKWKIDIINGKKTGFFWEQLAIQNALNPIIKGARVLDVFCQTGFCSLQAARFFAKEITGIDENKEAIAFANENTIQNKFQRKVNFIHGNPFDLLKSWSKKDLKYDFIILNPPSLAKSKKDLTKAIAGYKELNLRSFQLLHSGGFLISCCSSYLISEEMIINLLEEAAKDANKRFRIIGKINQPADHPVLWDLSSTNYFKGFVIEVNSKN